MEFSTTPPQNAKPVSAGSLERDPLQDPPEAKQIPPEAEIEPPITPEELEEAVASPDTFDLFGAQDGTAPADEMPPTIEEATRAAADTATGEKRKPGRPPGSKTKPKLPNFEGLTAAEAVAINYDETAGMLFDMTTGALASIIGPEWLAKDKGERNAMIGPIAAYLKSKEVKDIPPGMMLTICVLAYSGSRLANPNTRSFFGKTWDRCKLFGAWLKVKLQRKRKESK